MNKHIERKNQRIFVMMTIVLSLAYGHQKDILNVFFQYLYSGYTSYSKKVKKARVNFNKQNNLLYKKTQLLTVN